MRAAAIAPAALPAQLNPIVRPLMGAIQGGGGPIQARAAVVLAAVLHQYTSAAAAAPRPLADKVVANLCKLLAGRTIADGIQGA